MLLLVALVAWARTERAGNWVCGRLREKLPQVISADVAIGSCALDPFSGSVRLKDVTVSDQQTSKPLLTADEALVSLRGMFLGGVSLHEVRLVRPHVDVVLHADGTTPSSDVCALDQLRAVRIDDLEIQEGSVRVSSPDGRALQLDGLDVKASLQKTRADVEVSARGGVVTVDAQRRLALGRVSLEALLDLNARELEVRRSDVNVEGLTANATGDIRSLCDAAPTFSLNGQVYLPMSAVPRFGVPLDAPTGQAWVGIAVGGKLDAPTVRAQVHASQIGLGRFTPGDFVARLSWSGKEREVTIDEFSTRAGDGEVRVTGAVQLTAGLPVKLRVETKDVSFARVLERAGVPGSWVEFGASVKGAIGGKLLPSPVLGGDVEFRATRFLLASRGFDEPKTKGRDILEFPAVGGTFRLGVTSEAVTFDDISLRVGAEARTKVVGSAKLYTDLANKGLEVRARGTAVNLDDFHHIAGVPWSGVGTLEVSVAGAGASLAVDGQVALHDFKMRGYSLGVVQSPLRYSGHTLSLPGVVGQKGQTQYFGDVALEFRDDGLASRASIQLPDGRVEDVVDLLADLSPSMQNIQEVLVGRVGMVASFDSPPGSFDGVIAAHYRDVRYWDRRLGEADSILRFEGAQRMVLEPMTFSGPLGALAVDGTWDFEGPLDFRLSLEDGSLKEAISPLGSVAVSGPLSSHFIVSGTTDLVKVDGSMASASVTYAGRSLGKALLEAKLVGRDLSIVGTPFTGAKTRVAIRARNEWPSEGTLSLELPDATAFLPASVTGLGLAVGGTITAQGPLKDWEKSRVTAKLDRLLVSRGEVSAANVTPVELGWNAGALEVRSLAMKGQTTELSAQGTWGPTTVDLKTKGFVDLRLLSSLVPQVERTQGRLDFTGAFSGSVKAPTLLGGADLTDVRLSLKDQDLSVRALSGHADFSESRVLLQDVKGFLNDGHVRVRGDVRLEKGTVKTAELQTDLEDVTVHVTPRLPVTLSGSLLLASKGAIYQLSGGLDVVKFRYTDQQSLLSAFGKAKSTPVSSDELAQEKVRFDVDIATGQDVRIDGNVAPDQLPAPLNLSARLLGKVKLSGNNVKPVLIGAIETADGSQATFRGNTFSIGRGVLQFNGLWPTFDLSAQSQVREYLVSVKAFGRFEDPRVSLVSEPSLSEADVLSLLTIGVTTREKFAGQSGAGLAAEALLSASGIDQQVNRFLSRNVGLKDQQVRLTTSFNETTGAAEPSVTWQSKAFTDKLTVGVTQPVTGRGTKAQAEYRFNPGVSARAQWENNQNTSVGNPGVDLRFRFEWE